MTKSTENGREIPIMKCFHKIINSSSADLSFIPDGSVQLIVTSPPYPMIEMWDEIFFAQNPEIRKDFQREDYTAAYRKMHDILNRAWEECHRVLSDNGFVCINIGDATRTLGKEFRLFPNHAAIIDFFLKKGCCALPDIHWRKPTNAPNKFMGSGMYPAGAYVTYEHEYILIFRKGGKRKFDAQAAQLRRESAYFWEERNEWFSDLWEIKGTNQKIGKSSSRLRNASFPFEIPYRLINMYSIKGDTVLDPFCGLGTTNLACMASERNSIGVDIDEAICKNAVANLRKKTDAVNEIIDKRIDRHISFISSLSDDKRKKCYINEKHHFPVKTRQEIQLCIRKCRDFDFQDGCILCSYESVPAKAAKKK